MSFDDEPLPAWLSFDPVASTLAGTPPDPGRWSVVVMASDAHGHSVMTSFSLVVSAGRQEALETGWWWDPTAGGRGYAIESNGARLFFVDFLYDDLGAATWYLTQGTAVSDGGVDGSAIKYAGGQTLNGAYRPAAVIGSVGSVSLRPVSTRQATLRLAGSTLAISRFTFGTTPGALPAAGMLETGWWASDQGGRGWFLEVQGSSMYLGGFLYSDIGEATWVISQGPMTATSLYIGSLQQCAGGQPLSGPYRTPLCTVLPGTITIQFSTRYLGQLTLPNGTQVALRRFNF